MHFLVTRDYIVIFYQVQQPLSDDGHSPDPCGRSGNDGGGGVRCSVSGGSSTAPASVVGVVEQRSLAVVRHDGFGCAGSGRMSLGLYTDLVMMMMMMTMTMIILY